MIAYLVINRYMQVRNHTKIIVVLIKVFISFIDSFLKNFFNVNFIERTRIDQKRTRMALFKETLFNSAIEDFELGLSRLRGRHIDLHDLHYSIQCIVAEWSTVWYLQ